MPLTELENRLVELVQRVETDMQRQQANMLSLHSALQNLTEQKKNRKRIFAEIERTVATTRERYKEFVRAVKRFREAIERLQMRLLKRLQASEDPVPDDLGSEKEDIRPSPWYEDPFDLTLKPPGF